MSDAFNTMMAVMSGDDGGEAPSTGEMARRVMGTHLLDVQGDYARMGDWTAHQYVDTAMLLGHFPDDVYKATEERLGDSAERDKLEGISGFMHGWAENAARAILELPPVPNPAIIDLGGKP